MVTIRKEQKWDKEPWKNRGKEFAGLVEVGGQDKDPDVSQDVMQGSTVTALKHCWKSKSKRKRTHGKSLGEPVAEQKSSASKPSRKRWQTHPGTVRDDREACCESQAEHGPGVSLT